MVRPEAPAVNDSGTKCWFMSSWWVSAPSDTRLTARIEAASGVDTAIEPPYVVLPGALGMVGRAPADREGGGYAGAGSRGAVCGQGGGAAVRSGGAPGRAAGPALFASAPPPV